MENITLVSGDFEYSGPVGGHFENKVDENHLGTERILCAENRVKIRYRLGGEAGHTDRTHGHADGRTHRCQKGLP